MGKRQDKELRRLEEALLESDDMHEVPDFWETSDPETEDEAYVDYEVYNADDADVDLDAYSEDVHQGSRGNALPVVLTMATMVLLSAAILLFLNFLGVLG